MRIVDYLKRFKWSQTDLARHADVSPQTVRRAISGSTIAARSAQNITSAINRKEKEEGIKEEDIKGLRVTRPVRKKKKTNAEGQTSKNKAPSQVAR